MLQFQSGGVLEEGKFYVERPADTELPQLLLQGELVYVLAPRQIGKSSLRVRSAQHLRRQGVRCAAIGLDEIGTQISEQEWYFGIIRQLANQLELSDNPKLFWHRHRDCSPMQRWFLFLREQVLNQIPEPIVIFFDEVETTRALLFGNDDFFLSIRAAFNLRATDADFRRLTFCLLGLTLPGDLIADDSRSPFNIGKSMQLEDFTRDQAGAFLPGLQQTTDDPEYMLDIIHDWSQGHPYMTQLLCEKLLLQPQRTGSPEDRVKSIAAQSFFDKRQPLDINLRCAEKCFERANEDLRITKMLRLYERLISSPEPIKAQGHDPIQMALRLTGMAAERREGAETVLRARNRIFTQVFDRQWVRARQIEHLITESMQRWLDNAKHDEFLLRGEALDKACQWSQGREDVTPDERGYLMAGLVIRGQEEVAQKQRERALERARSRLQSLVLLGVGILGLVGVTAVWGWQYLREQAKAQRALMGQKAKLLARLSGQKVAAVELALKAMGPNLSQSRPAEDQAASGLVAATSAVVRFRWSLKHRAGVLAAAFSPRGDLVATGGGDQVVRIWDATKGTALWQSEPQAGSINSVNFSADGAFLLTGGSDGVVRIWNLPVGDSQQAGLPAYDHKFPVDLLVHFPSSKNQALCEDLTGISAAVFSPDGTRIITANADKTAGILDSQSGRVLRVLRGHEGSLTSAAFSPGGTQVITSGCEAVARIWEVSTGTLIRTLHGHKGCILSVAFSPDGQRVATAGADQTARIWDARTGTLVYALVGHTDRVSSVAFSATGKQLVTASFDHTARVWDAVTGSERLSLEAHADALNAAAFSPDGQQVITASNDGTARIWDLRGGRVFMALEDTQVADAVNRPSWVLTAAFSADGRFVLTAGADHTARIWDAETGNLKFPRIRDASWVKAALFHPDGARVITGGEDGWAWVWEAKTGRKLWGVPVHPGALSAMAISPDGKLLATASSTDASARIWDLKARSQQVALRGHEAVVSDAVLAAIAFAPRGDLIITGGGDGTARVWDVRSGEPRQILRGHAGGVRAVAFSPAGKLVVTGGKDGTARVWDVQSGRQTLRLEGHTGPISTVAFSPDGTRIATASWDSTAQLWNATDGTPLWTFAFHDAPLYAASFSPDGRRLVTAGIDGQALLIPATLEGYLDFAQRFRADRSSATHSDPEPQAVTLGPLDINDCCQAWEGARAHAVPTQYGYSPGAAYSWRCVIPGNECSMTYLGKCCQQAYGDPLANVRLGDFNNANSWYCYRP